MPNKLTDAEVKKALKEYINFADLEYINHTSIRLDILKNALDLINRYEAEVERLSNNISAMAITLSTSARATRHEAYTEFAVKLLALIGSVELPNLELRRHINNLLNELVGDGDGN